MDTIAINPDQPVDDLMRRWPATIGVFLRRRMACVGCPVARFHSVEEASKEYGVPVGRLIEELRIAATTECDVPL